MNVISKIEAVNQDFRQSPRTRKIPMKHEAIVISVSDVDRAKQASKELPS
jgi:hypothetical protein